MKLIDLNEDTKKIIKNSLKDKFITIFWKQNKWHKHGVLMHTMSVVWEAVKNGDFRMIPAALLHDIGKPLVATKDNDGSGDYSFKDHEEKSYQIIKNWNFISKYTKDLVRWHYLIRGIDKSREKSMSDKYNDAEKASHKADYERQKKTWESLNKEMKMELARFLKHDDNGKGRKKK